MPHALTDIALTPSGTAAQQPGGSATRPFRSHDVDVAVWRKRLGEARFAFVPAPRRFQRATAFDTGWPDPQHREGPSGLLTGLSACVAPSASAWRWAACPATSP